MPKYTDIKKVLVLGSGPIVIGQAAEFDYAGTQACRALKEEGLEVVLVNSNPATIMTDKDIADHVYIEPMNIPSITQVIEKERPDAPVSYTHLDVYKRQGQAAQGGGARPDPRVCSAPAFRALSGGLLQHLADPLSHCPALRLSLIHI